MVGYQPSNGSGHENMWGIWIDCNTNIVHTSHILLEFFLPLVTQFKLLVPIVSKILRPIKLVKNKCERDKKKGQQS